MREDRRKKAGREKERERERERETEKQTDRRERERERIRAKETIVYSLIPGPKTFSDSSTLLLLLIYVLQ